jgi:hypothetical protein
VELKPADLAPRYGKILERCEPFLVTFPGNHGALDLAPFGLAIKPEHIYDPTRLRSRTIVDGLHHLDAFSFGGQEMLMPRWVLFDCGEFPGIVFGFGRNARDLAPELRRAYDVVDPARDGDFIPLSMWVAIRCAEDGAWFGHNLSSSNYVAKTEPLTGLGTITKAYGMRVAKVRRQYGATQWASTSLNIHLSLGDNVLLGAYTPAHTHIETFTYRIEVNTDRLVAPMRPGWTREETGGDRYVDADDPRAISELHGEIEAGRKFRLVRVEARPNAGQRLWLHSLADG